MSYYTRPATIKDVEKMRRLISFYAAKKLMLPRDRSYLHKLLANYSVAIGDGKFAGTCGFRLWQPDWLEVVSLAVKPEFQHQGIGTALIQSVINKGVSLGFNYFFTLTLVPELFLKSGFKKTSFKKIMFKVESDCRNCPKNDAGPGKGSCNEIPLELTVKS
jgi:argininosuccinate lyase/amino-acid N-acetyltransferase